MYCIAGNIGGQFNLAVWPQISIAKNLNIGGFINLVVWYRVVYASMKYNYQIFSLYGIATARVLYCFSPNEYIGHALALILTLSLSLSLSDCTLSQTKRAPIAYLKHYQELFRKSSLQIQ